jgi:hypothetical protein
MRLYKMIVHPINVRVQTTGMYQIDKQSQDGFGSGDFQLPLFTTITIEDRCQLNWETPIVQYFMALESLILVMLLCECIMRSICISTLLTR